jgi:hypothetical protein
VKLKGKLNMRQNKCKGKKGKYRKNKWILRRIRKAEEREREREKKADLEKKK